MKKRSVGAVLVLFVLMILVSPAHSSEQPDKVKREAQKLAEALEYNYLFGSVQENFIGYLRFHAQDIDGQVWDAAVKEINIRPKETSAAAKLLEENFTLSELEELNNFYSSELQQKVKKKIPEILQAVMNEQISDQKAIFEKVILNLEAQGQNTAGLKKAVGGMFGGK